MTYACLLLPVVVGCQCQPVAPRYAVSKVTRTVAANQTTTTTTQSFTYQDAHLFGGRELEGGSLSISSSTGGPDDQASYSFEYDDDGLLVRWSTTSSNDNLDRTVYFRYNDDGRIHMIETDAGPSNISEVNIEANYLENGQLEQVIWKWGWWILQSNERAVASYNDRGFIQDLDGASTDVHYAWGDDGLEQVDVLLENQDDQHYALGYNDEQRLAHIDQDTNHWTLGYDDGGRLERIEVDRGGTQETVAYEYADGSIQGMRIAPRLPLFVNFVFDTDGRALTDLDLLALPDYF